MKTTQKLLITFLVPLMMLFPLILRTDAQEAGVETGSASPTSIVLAVDSTGSMAGERLTAVNLAVQNIFEETGNTVPMALISYNDEATLLVDFTTSDTDILNGLERIQPAGNTALYDALYEAVRVASSAPAGDRIVIFLTDGTNSGSQATLTEAIQLAQSENVVVNTIGLGTDASRSFVSEVASQTGGRSMIATSFDLIEAYNTIVADLDLSIPAEVVSSETSAIEVVGAAEVPSDITVLTGAGAGTQSDAGAVEITGAVTTSSSEGAITPLNAVSTTGDRDPIAVVFAFDNTGSVTADILQDFSSAVGVLNSTLSSQVPMALIAFNEETQILSNFGTGITQIQDAIVNLNPAGRSALYDATVTATLIAAEANAETPTVIFLTDGSDSASNATEQTALDIANETGVRINTIALGPDADLAYLQNLAQATGGDYYATNSSSDLPDIFANVAGDMASVIQSTQPSVIDSVLSGEGSGINPLELDTEETFQDVEAIAPLNSDLIDLGFNTDASEASTAGITTDTGDETPVDQESADGTIDPSDLASNVIQPDAIEFFPIEIALEDDELNVELAELSLNQVTLAVYDRAPFEYSLRSDLLRRGNYILTFSVVNDRDVVFRDTLEFVVELNAAGEPMILVDGQARSLILTFAPIEGLDFAPDPTLDLELAQSQTLGDILLRPFDNVPEPIRDALTQQRPGLVVGLIVAMTFILLPQGLFTVYWMTYTWVNPERMKRSGAPEEYYEPEISFTALLPARKEESVIYETIRIVDEIDYPEHLKEILILIRDEDDDDTIAESHRAIADIKKSYEDKGEEWPNNVHLITFTDGPKNKPNGLNRGYKASTKDVLCIFDAEDAPHAQIYNTINTVMLRDDADVVQAGVQLMNFDYNWFSAFNVLEYFFWFKSGLHAFTHGTNVTPLGGNTVFFGKDWLDKLAAQDLEKGYRAWDEGTLTEDADVGFRLTTLGASIQIVYEAELATQEETPHNVEQFIKQRTRWCQGFYEIFRKADWLTLPTMKQRIAAIYILLNSLLQASILIFLPIGLFIALTQRVSVIISLVSYFPIFLMFVQGGITLVGIREFTESYGLKLPLGFRLRMIFFYYPYQLLLSVSAMRAVFRFLSNQNSWEKTAHSNLHRQNASAAAGH